MSIDKSDLILDHRIGNDILIYHGNMRLTIADKSFDFQGVVFQEHKSANSIKITGIAHDISILEELAACFFDGGDTTVDIPEINKSRIRIDSSKLTKGNLVELACSVEKIERTQSKPVNSLILDVCNYFPGLYVNKLIIEDWIIDLHKRDDEEEIFNELVNRSENVITHRFEISRTDGNQFDPRGGEVTALIKALEWACSFTVARHIKGVRIFGFQKNRLVVEGYFSNISIPYSSWGKDGTWFHPQFSSFDCLIKNVYEYIKRAHDWDETFQIYLFWYVDAMNTKTSMIESCITSIQIAIEAVWYYYFVAKNNLILESKINVSDQIRMLLNELKFNNSILPEDRKNFKIRNTVKDGPHLLTGVRNSVVHPKKNEDFKRAEAKLIAWKYGIHYLELSILYLLSYKGKYQERLPEWLEIKNVPWL